MRKPQLRMKEKKKRKIKYQRQKENNLRKKKKETKRRSSSSSRRRKGMYEYVLHIHGKAMPNYIHTHIGSTAPCMQFDRMNVNMCRHRDIHSEYAMI